MLVTWGFMIALAPFLRYLIGILLVETGGSTLAAGLLHASMNAAMAMTVLGNGWPALPALVVLTLGTAALRIEATRRIIAAGLETRVLVLTTFHHDDYVWGALQAGASGFLLKRASPERLIDAVRTLAAGDALLDPAVTRDLVAQFVGQGLHRTGTEAPDRRLAQLTDRERQVLRLAAEGYSNAEIADLLTIAESTAKTHVKRILAKIDARDRAQAVVIAYQSRLMGSPD